MAKQLPKRDLENVGVGVTGACIALVAFVVTLVAMVAERALGFSSRRHFGSFFTGTKWNPIRGRKRPAHVGALPMIAASFSVTLLSTLIALPIAIGCAIFAVEISVSVPRSFSRLLSCWRASLGRLRSYRLDGHRGLVRDAAAAMGQTITGFGIFSSAVVLAVMILPTITSLSIDALAAVPHEYREGSYALGCTRWQTIWNVVLKSAAPSLMTAVILGMTRAFGEALAVQMVIGRIQMPSGLFTPASTLTSVLTMGMGI